MMASRPARRAYGGAWWIATATAAAVGACGLIASSPLESGTSTIALRGRPQQLHVFGQRGSTPVIVSSSDGGWVRLGPHIADVLGRHGYFVVGFDSKAYLESFTSGTETLKPADEPGDYRTLVDFARDGARLKPTLIGVSEGAGLSVLAATDADLKKSISGVVGVGLPDLTELAWRWKDAVIYVTHGVPNEPTFSTAAIINQVAPVPLSVVHASHDDFVPLPEISRILSHAGEPKQLRIVETSSHRFEDALPVFDRELLAALDWIRSQSAR